jgi:L-lysine exporter family protein LysE/ArgO
MFEVILQGALISGALIIAIGSQNAYVLKQGLLNNHIFYVSFISTLGDLLLIALGVFGFGILSQEFELFTKIITVAGILFLLYYGTSAFISSYKANNNLSVSLTTRKDSFKKTLIMSLSMSLLNPHAYLDTVIIIGGLTSNYTYDNKVLFYIGASIGSSIWFFSLGYGAKFLIPLFKKNRTWQILDFFIGCMMYYIALSMAMLLFSINQ